MNAFNRYSSFVWILAASGVVTKGIDGGFSYDKLKCVPGPHGVNRTAESRAPSTFGVRFAVTASTNKRSLMRSIAGTSQEDRFGSFEVQLNRTWAPIGVDRFYQLVLDNYYDCAAFFRVVPGTYILSRFLYKKFMDFPISDHFCLLLR